MANFLLDTFTGTAGTALTSHTGELGATWFYHNHAAHEPLVLDGSGGVHAPGAGVPYDHYIGSSAATTPATGEVTYTLTFTSGAAGGWALGIAVIDSIWEFNGFDIELDSTGPNWGLYAGIQIAGVPDTGFSPTFDTGIPYSTGEHILQVTIDPAGTGVTVLLDGVVIGSGTTDAPLPTNLVPGFYFKPLADGSEPAIIEISATGTGSGRRVNYLLDTFTAANGTQLAAHIPDKGYAYAMVPGSASSEAVITANRLRHTVGAATSFYSTTPMPSNDFVVQVTMRFASSHFCEFELAREGASFGNMDKFVTLDFNAAGNATLSGAGLGGSVSVGGFLPALNTDYVLTVVFAKRGADTVVTYGIDDVALLTRTIVGDTAWFTGYLGLDMFDSLNLDVLGLDNLTVYASPPYPAFWTNYIKCTEVDS